ncbi:hypothetical protein WDJ51_13265 [Rathayibacter sp. YIM 133350]|uniref:hypothetical protein n=1 Tax=Rathayibacter sp. YIM 133350 TaxID=3131992 RepID=UPI00307D0829
MSDEIPGGGGPLLVHDGSIAVASDELYAASQRLRWVAREADSWVAGLAAAVWVDGSNAGVLSAARSRAADISAQAGHLAGALDLSAAAYGLTERSLEAMQETAGSVLAWWAGFCARVTWPLWVAAGAALSIDVAVAWLAANGWRRLTGRSALDGADFLREHREILNSPLTSALVRTLVSSVDDAVEGAQGIPLPLVRAFGESGAGLTGVSSSAFGLLAVAGMLGLLRESAVSTRRVDADGVGLRSTARRGADLYVGQAVQAPTGVAELLDRIPPAVADEPQVRIERYGSAQAPDWVVYISGTSGWELSGSPQPWDATSDVQALAGQESGSYRAVLDALDAAGVKPGDSVTAVGHSQGGLLAAQLVADDRFSAAGLVTAGAPLAGVRIPDEVPVLQLEHTDDIVPALSGLRSSDASADHLIVSREHGLEGPADSLVPAHAIGGYRQTGALVDASDDPRLQRLREVLLERVATDGEATWWLGVRENVSRASPDGR